jgi:dipeptidyl aminopeptidase/acylaminoacyl peptidase
MTRHRFAGFALRLSSALVIIACAASVAAEPTPLTIDDLYATDSVADPITLGDGRTAIYTRARVAAGTRRLQQSLWRVDDSGPPRPLEKDEPHAFSPQLSPDGKWILFLSGRPFSDGTPAFVPVPPYSDQAADIWLIPVAGGNAIPLAGKSKPYGRVIADRFYGRVVFSPDGKRLAFVADDGRDERTEAERQNGVIVVREDQGEGYEGYRPTQIWIADLLESPDKVAAAKVTRFTHDDFWYGDPQWSPDGSFLVVHANRTGDQESVRYSINRNFDLWKIDLDDERLVQLTTGPGPEFSPRLSPDGKRVLCLSSPRKGPHMDVFNLKIVDLATLPPRETVLLDYHQGDLPSVLPPASPLPEDCWLDKHHVAFTAYQGLKSTSQSIDIEKPGQTIELPPPKNARRSPLVPASRSTFGPRLRAHDEVVRWNGTDGRAIEGVVTLPPPALARPPFKLLLLPHGGPHSRSSSGSGFDAQIFAMNGYAVFQPNFRGSAGYSRDFLDADRFDLGGGDMHDILSGIEHLVSRGIADRERQFVYGISYGGYMTTWLVGHTKQFRAAVAQNAVTDLNVMWHLSDLQSWTEWEMGGFPWQVPERMREHSPIAHIENVRTPTLILHSLNDRRCPVAMGRMFHRALKERGIETGLVLYPDEGHAIRHLPHREDVLRRVLDWFARHDISAN